MIYGAYIPHVDYRSGDNMEDCIQIFNHWINRYPPQMQLYAFGKKGEFKSSFLSLFVGFRKKIHDLKRMNPELDGNYLDSTIIIDVEEFDFLIEELEQVFLIINMNEQQAYERIKNMSINFHNCDQVVRKFGLDKQRQTYFHNSRKCLIE